LSSTQARTRSRAGRWPVTPRPAICVDLEEPPYAFVQVQAEAELSFMGVANVNLAKMVTDDINAHGGLLGRPVELYVEDSATDDEIAHTAAARLVREADVDVVIGGIYSSTRQAIKRPVVDRIARNRDQEAHARVRCPARRRRQDPGYVSRDLNPHGVRGAHAPPKPWLVAAEFTLDRGAA